MPRGESPREHKYEVIKKEHKDFGVNNDAGWDSVVNGENTETIDKNTHKKLVKLLDDLNQFYEFSELDHLVKNTGLTIGELCLPEVQEGAKEIFFMSLAEGNFEYASKIAEIFYLPSSLLKSVNAKDILCNGLLVNSHNSINNSKSFEILFKNGFATEDESIEILVSYLEEKKVIYGDIIKSGDIGLLLDFASKKPAILENSKFQIIAKGVFYDLIYDIRSVYDYDSAKNVFNIIRDKEEVISSPYFRVAWLGGLINIVGHPSEFERVLSVWTEIIQPTKSEIVSILLESFDKSLMLTDNIDVNWIEKIMLSQGISPTDFIGKDTSFLKRIVISKLLSGADIEFDDCELVSQLVSLFGVSNEFFKDDDLRKNTKEMLSRLFNSNSKRHFDELVFVMHIGESDVKNWVAGFILNTVSKHSSSVEDNEIASHYFPDGKINYDDLGDKSILLNSVNIALNDHWYGMSSLNKIMQIIDIPDEFWKNKDVQDGMVNAICSSFERSPNSFDLYDSESEKFPFPISQEVKTEVAIRICLILIEKNFNRGDRNEVLDFKESVWKVGIDLDQIRSNPKIILGIEKRIAEKIKILSIDSRLICKSIEDLTKYFGITKEKIQIIGEEINVRKYIVEAAKNNPSVIDYLLDMFDLVAEKDNIQIEAACTMEFGNILNISRLVALGKSMSKDVLMDEKVQLIAVKAIWSLGGFYASTGIKELREVFLLEDDSYFKNIITHNFFEIIENCDLPKVLARIEEFKIDTNVIASLPGASEMGNKIVQRALESKSQVSKMVNVSRIIDIFGLDKNAVQKNFSGFVINGLLTGMISLDDFEQAKTKFGLEFNLDAGDFEKEFLINAVVKNLVDGSTKPNCSRNILYLNNVSKVFNIDSEIIREAIQRMFLTVDSKIRNANADKLVTILFGLVEILDDGILVLLNEEIIQGINSYYIDNLKILNLGLIERYELLFGKQKMKDVIIAGVQKYCLIKTIKIEIIFKSINWLGGIPDELRDIVIRNREKIRQELFEMLTNCNCTQFNAFCLEFQLPKEYIRDIKIEALLETSVNNSNRNFNYLLTHSGILKGDIDLFQRGLEKLKNIGLVGKAGFEILNKISTSEQEAEGHRRLSYFKELAARIGVAISDVAEGKLNTEEWGIVQSFLKQRNKPDLILLTDEEIDEIRNQIIDKYGVSLKRGYDDMLNYLGNSHESVQIIWSYLGGRNKHDLLQWFRIFVVCLKNVDSDGKSRTGLVKNMFTRAAMGTGLQAHVMNEIMQKMTSEMWKKLETESNYEGVEPPFADMHSLDLHRIMNEIRLHSMPEIKEAIASVKNKPHLHDFAIELIRHPKVNVEAIKHFIENPQKFFDSRSGAGEENTAVNTALTGLAPNRWKTFSFEKARDMIVDGGFDDLNAFHFKRVEWHDDKKLNVRKKNYFQAIDNYRLDGNDNSAREMLSAVYDLGKYSDLSSEILKGLKQDLRKEIFLNYIDTDEEARVAILKFISEKGKKIALQAGELEYKDSLSMVQSMIKKKNAQKETTEAELVTAEKEGNQARVVLLKDNLIKITQYLDLLNNRHATIKAEIVARCEELSRLASENDYRGFFDGVFRTGWMIKMDLAGFIKRAIGKDFKTEDDLVVGRLVEISQDEARREELIKMLEKIYYSLEGRLDLNWYCAEVLPPSSPLSALAGTQSGSCDSFGSGKKAHFMVNGGIAQFVLMNAKGGRPGEWKATDIVAQSTMTLEREVFGKSERRKKFFSSLLETRTDKKISSAVKSADFEGGSLDFLQKFAESEEHVCLDSVEVGQDFRGKYSQKIVLGLLKKSFDIMGEDDPFYNKKVISGLQYTYLSSTDLPRVENTGLIYTPLAYSDNIIGQNGFHLDSAVLVRDAGEKDTREVKKDGINVRAAKLTDSIPIALMEDIGFSRTNGERHITGLVSMTQELWGSVAEAKHSKHCPLAYVETEVKDGNEYYRGYLIAYISGDNSIYITDTTTTGETKGTGTRLIYKFLSEISNDNKLKNFNISMSCRGTTSAKAISKPSSRSLMDTLGYVVDGPTFEEVNAIVGEGYDRMFEFTLRRKK